MVCGLLAAARWRCRSQRQTAGKRRAALEQRSSVQWLRAHAFLLRRWPTRTSPAAESIRRSVAGHSLYQLRHAEHPRGVSELLRDARSMDGDTLIVDTTTSPTPREWGQREAAQHRDVPACVSGYARVLWLAALSASPSSRLRWLRGAGARVVTRVGAILPRRTSMRAYSVR